MPGGRGRSERSRLFRLAGKGDFNYFFFLKEFSTGG